MRVLLKRLRPERPDRREARDEHGAIAVMAALFSVTLMVTAAFTVDLGIAYTSRMALQTAADAGSLAAAATYAGAPGSTCPDLVAAVPETTAAGAAGTYLEKNRSTLSTDPQATLEVACDGGRLEVSYQVSADTPTFFGRLAGAGDTLTRAARATAAVEVSPAGPGVRPLAVCSAELPLELSPGVVWRSYQPGQGRAPAETCPLPPTAGTWWTLDCPGESGGTSELEEQIRTGCPGSVGIGDVLGGDPGQPDAGQQPDAWAGLINAGTTFGLPVAVPATGSGTHAAFPVERLIAVSVCGYHFGKQLKKRYAPGVDACAPAAAEAAALMADEEDTNYLLLVSRASFTSGGTADHPCVLGDAACDGGFRRVRLAE